MLGALTETENKIIKAVTNYRIKEGVVAIEPQSIFITEIEQKLEKAATIYEINTALAYLSSKSLVREKAGVIEPTQTLLELLSPFDEIPF